jgi:hypothetical protein
MSDTSFAAVSRQKELVDIADEDWLNDTVSDDGECWLHLCFILGLDEDISLLAS